jgi:hypothetical protein
MGKWFEDRADQFAWSSGIAVAILSVAGAVCAFFKADAPAMWLGIGSGAFGVLVVVASVVAARTSSRQIAEAKARADWAAAQAEVGIQFGMNALEAQAAGAQPY